ncbi:MAG: ASKHA domain-containing protein [Oscillospiraceae bacterium]|jgi:uncharacterized 2Fe-2S/4Fe-4S cluster protein (DUF4445 family)|nr:ASKHA domain-containing protein [Oscillospiraceae bacterium]
MQTVTITPAYENQLLSDAMRAAGVPCPLPCGGRGKCGNCKVAVENADGTFTYRLACQWRIREPAKVLPPFHLYKPPEERAAVTAASGTSMPFGLAIDIGTTTVSALLVAEDGTIIDDCHALNAQSHFGADVLSRIHAAAAALQPLQTAILSQLRGMKQSLAAPYSLPCVITGNTTMLHMLCGLDPTPLGQAPFTPRSRFGRDWKCDGLSPAIYLPPCICAFVGADITCGMLSCGFGQTDETLLLADVGTNGELVLQHDGKIYCCSTAAGPAFEGAEISRGMPAVSGAICKVYQGRESINFAVVNDARPMGICGTGLLSALRVFLDRGELDESGYIENDSLPIGRSGISVTQADIRKLQLVKASICAGIETLLHEAGITAADVDKTLLAGGFGTSLDPADAAAIGMIPAELASKAIGVGNTALQGAVTLLCHPERKAAIQTLAAAAREIPLATHPVFGEAFIDRMAFGLAS